MKGLFKLFDDFLKIIGAIFFPSASKERGIYSRVIYDSPSIFPQSGYRERINAQIQPLLLQSFIAKEGERLTVYRDSLGKLTVGIGHLVLPRDGLKYGDRITQTQSRAFFAKDIKKALDAAKEQAAELGKYTVDFIIALTHVNFQSGIFWRTIHPKTWDALKRGDSADAVRELRSSLWYRQTPTRVVAFINAINENFG